MDSYRLNECFNLWVLKVFANNLYHSSSEHPEIKEQEIISKWGVLPLIYEIFDKWEQLISRTKLIISFKS